MDLKSDNDLAMDISTLQICVKLGKKRFVNKTYKIDLDKNKKKLNIDWMDYQTDLKKALNVKNTGITPLKKELKTLVDNNKFLEAKWRR